MYANNYMYIHMKVCGFMYLYMYIEAKHTCRCSLGKSQTPHCEILIEMIRDPESHDLHLQFGVVGIKMWYVVGYWYFKLTTPT